MAENKANSIAQCYWLSIAACETKEHENTIAGSINSYTHQLSHTYVWSGIEEQYSDTLLL